MAATFQQSEQQTLQSIKWLAQSPLRELSKCQHDLVLRSGNPNTILVVESVPALDCLIAGMV